MKLLVFSILLFSRAQASPDRVSAIQFDKSKVQRVYLATGLATVLIFPCSLTEVIVGDNDDIKSEISEKTKNLLTVYLKTKRSGLTNLIARCGDSDDLFVFDLVPHEKLHQDFIKIDSYYGQPSHKRSLRLIDDSTSNSNDSNRVIVLKKPRLVREKK